jgi:hypothetical protein
MSNPGFEERERLRAQLPKLSRRHRTAFAAAVAERVLPLATHFFGKRTACDEAVELAWNYASGATLPKGEARKAADKCERLIDRLYAQDDTDYPMYVAKAAAGAVQSINGTTSDGAEEAAFCAQDAVGGANAKQADAAVQEEAEWQVLALAIALVAPKPARDMFASLPPTPRWLEKFRRKKK